MQPIMMPCLALTAGLAFTSAAKAQEQESARILVSAKGNVETPPDRAVVTYTLHGEGPTSDAALTQLQQRAAAIERALTGFLKTKPDIHTGDLAIREVRGAKCDMRNYGPARLSTETCAIEGHVADLPVTLRTDQVDRAGTLTGLIGRYDGRNPRIASFQLSDARAAQDEAMRRAIANAHDQAELIAQGTGGTLGPVLRIQDANYRELRMGMAQPVRSAPPSPVPPPPPPPAVAIALRPAPITTSVQIMVAYALAD